MEMEITTDLYWDCECDKEFIHPKSMTKCPKCGALADESPDSITNEVVASGLPVGK